MDFPSLKRHAFSVLFSLLVFSSFVVFLLNISKIKFYTLYWLSVLRYFSISTQFRRHVCILDTPDTVSHLRERNVTISFKRNIFIIIINVRTRTIFLKEICGLDEQYKVMIKQYLKYHFILIYFRSASIG